MAKDQDVASFYFIEYVKIFGMMAVSMVLLRTVDQLYFLVIQSALALGYIAFEVNDLYLRNRLSRYLPQRVRRIGQQRGRVDARHGGADLRSPVGSSSEPLALVLPSSCSRDYPCCPDDVFAGAMLSLLVMCPLLAIRCKRRLQLAALGAVFFVGAIPVMAGPEIRARFLTLDKNEEDESANIRRSAWAAAWKMAKD